MGFQFDFSDFNQDHKMKIVKFKLRHFLIENSGAVNLVYLVY